MGLYRVLINRYDDFPGHYDEFINILDTVVQANDEQEIINTFSVRDRFHFDIHVGQLCVSSLDELRADVRDIKESMGIWVDEDNKDP